MTRHKTPWFAHLFSAKNLVYTEPSPDEVTIICELAREPDRPILLKIDDREQARQLAGRLLYWADGGD